MSEMKEANEAKEGFERCLDSELWHACAGGMVQMPPLNSKVFYFPQGHAEHTLAAVDFGALPNYPPMFLCRVESVKFLADPETDEVYARIRLVPVGKGQHHCFEEDDVSGGGSDSGAENKPVSFAKTLTQSDANNGGGFSVPRYCAETIFPPLNLRANPPVQNVFAKDVHGATWKFRHIFRGTPRRHLLTTGWSTFVNQKKLVAGDSIVFLKSDNGDLSVGIRRAKKTHLSGAAAGSEILSGWSSSLGFSPFSRGGDSHQNTAKEKGRVTPASVIEATHLAANGQPFEVSYYPSSNTPEFFVRASSVSSAMSIQWCPGMRFKMAFETEDSSRISWFLGTVSAVRAIDPARWPNSPWRMLRVNWDEPDLLQNVKCVSPWLVEVVSNVPLLHFSQSRKKLRFTNHPNDFPIDGPFRIPGQPNTGLRSLFGLSDNLSNNSFPAGIQGTRHVAQIGIPLMDFNLGGNNYNNNQLQQQIGIFRPNYSSFLQQRPPIDRYYGASPVREGEKKPSQFMLFGKVILTEQQMMDNKAKGSSSMSELGLEVGHCKVFLESEDVGRILDLSVLGSYGEMYERLYEMFGIRECEMHGHVLYRDVEGVVKQVGEEPFREFAKAAKRLTIFTKPNCNNGAERKVMTGLATGEHGGLGSSDRAGPLTIFV